MRGKAGSKQKEKYRVTQTGLSSSTSKHHKCPRQFYSFWIWATQSFEWIWGLRTNHKKQTETYKNTYENICCNNIIRNLGCVCKWVEKVRGQVDSGQVKGPACFQAEETKYKPWKRGRITHWKKERPETPLFINNKRNFKDRTNLWCFSIRARHHPLVMAGQKGCVHLDSVGGRPGQLWRLTICWP